MIKADFKTRAKKLKRLGFKNYAAYLLSDWWKNRRKRYSDEHGAACECCGRTPADCHHRSYGRLGAEADNDLMMLCGTHHREASTYFVIPQPATPPQLSYLRSLGAPDERLQRLSLIEASTLIDRIQSIRKRPIASADPSDGRHLTIDRKTAVKMATSCWHTVAK